MVSTNTKTF